MKIFKAEPLESKLDDPSWETSIHKGWVVVRAKSKEQAMGIAREEFWRMPKKLPGAAILTPPWGDSALVVWSEINDHKYPVEGKEEILDKG